eukprot:GEMP01001984.1.p1 GENE.GEMP01001984.1~~GEMP01001984.1.p1  ORF type:complete len:1343 (+),score=248.56 GEMP01001984.1:645-4673(+)
MLSVRSLWLLLLAPTTVVLSSGGHSETQYHASHAQCSFPNTKLIRDSATCEIAAKQVQEEENEELLQFETRKVEGLTGPLCARDNVANKVYFAEPVGASGSHGFVDYFCEMVDHHFPPAMGPVLFFIFAMFIATLSQLIESFLPAYFHPPHTVVLFIMGVILAAIGFAVDKAYSGENVFGYYVKSFAVVDPHVIFWIILPPLLFEDAANAHWHVLFRVLPNVLLLAVPGVIVNTLITGGLVFGLFSTTSGTLTIFLALLLGSILSATDPVAVIGTLHSLRAPDKLSSLIAGEALLNDGTAVVLFRIFFDVAKGLRSFFFSKALVQFIQLSLGGIGFGLLFALALHVALNLAKHRFTLQIMYVVLTIYACFFLAEQAYIDVSGVLGVVTVGFYMSAIGQYRIDGDRLHEYHTIFHFLATIANESLFVLAGVVTWRFTFETSPDNSFQPFGTAIHFLELLLLYVIIHFSRAVSIVLFWPFLVRAGYGLRPKEAIILIFGGLRGAIGLALAMMVDLDNEQPLPIAIRGRIAFHVSGITLLTLIVNGSAVGKLYKNLRIYKHATYHDALLTRALEQAESESYKRVQELEKNWFFHNTYFDLILKAVPNLAAIMDPSSLKRKKMDRFSRATRMVRVPLSEIVKTIVSRATKNPKEYESRYFVKLRFNHHSAQRNFMCFLRRQAPKWEVEFDEVVQRAILLAMTLPGKNKETELSPEVLQRIDREAAEDDRLALEERRLRNTEGGMSMLSPAHSGFIQLPRSITLEGHLSNCADALVRRESLAHDVLVAEHSPVGWARRNTLEAGHQRSKLAMGHSSIFHESEGSPRLSRQIRKPKCGVNRDGNETRLNVDGLYYCFPDDQHQNSVGSVAGSVEVAHSTCNRRHGQCVSCVAFQHSCDDGILKWGPMTLDPIQRQRAKMHWTIVRKRVWEVVHIINLSRKEFASQERKRSHNPAVIGGPGGGSDAQRWTDVMRRNVLTDDESRAEVFHTILNATHARLDQMFQARAIHVTSYKELLASLDCGDEAIAGELRPYSFLDANEDLQGLSKKSHREQMEKSLEVVWAYLANHLASHTHFASTLSHMVPSKIRDFFGAATPLKLSWIHLRRNMEIVLAYILVHEQQLHEISLLHDFPRVRLRLKALTNKAKADYLYSMEREHKDLFLIAEHLIGIKTVILLKQEILQEYVALGIIKAEDFDSINKAHFIPALRELNQFAPTQEHLSSEKKSRSSLHIPFFSAAHTSRNAQTEVSHRHVSESGRDLSQSRFGDIANASPEELVQGDGSSERVSTTYDLQSVFGDLRMAEMEDLENQRGSIVQIVSPTRVLSAREVLFRHHSNRNLRLPKSENTT